MAAFRILPSVVHIELGNTPISGGKHQYLKSRIRLYYVRWCKKLSRSKRLYLKSTSRLYYVRRCKKTSSTNIESLPDELLFDILERLPASYLHHKARLVCRRWCHTIRSHAFISSHIQHPTNGLLLASSSYRNRCSFFVTVTKGRIETHEFHYIRRARIMAACNGLCLKFSRARAPGEPRSVYVINPATKKSFLLPPVPTRDRVSYYDCCGFSYSAASMEYKVTQVYADDSSDITYLDIATVGVDKCWRHVEIQHLPPDYAYLLRSRPVTTEGFLHWGTITMNEVPIPYGDDTEWLMYEYLSGGRYLSLLAGSFGCWKVWEMNPQSMEWRMLPYRIRIDDVLKRVRFAGRLDMYPIGWVKYPEVLAFSSDVGPTCVFYNLQTHKFKRFRLPYRSVSRFKAYQHTNSFTWLSGNCD